MTWYDVPSVSSLLKSCLASEISTPKQYQKLEGRTPSQDAPIFCAKSEGPSFSTTLIALLISAVKDTDQAPYKKERAPEESKLLILGCHHRIQIHFDQLP
jgi:hypothetical protein